MAKLAILGYGTVGSGVAHVLDENVSEVKRSAGEEVTLKSILDLREFPGDPHESQVTHDFQVILNDPEISVVCETMGGIKPALEFTRELLKAKKSVCTSNKELVAKHGPELVQLARDNGVSYLFEASVGGGIPILRTLAGALASERIDEIAGILNGTTNFVLTRMEEDGEAFDDVLKKAQELGYAERDPSADIEGHDACRKIAILGSLMTNGHVDPETVPTEGITRITAEDLKLAGELGGTIKLLGSCRRSDDGLEIIVAPFFITLKHPLASVKGVFNAIAVHGNMLGTSMYYGQGAGRDATASAVAADVCEIVRNAGRTVPVAMSDSETRIAPAGDAVRRFFVRLRRDCLTEAVNALPGGSMIPGENEACAYTAFITAPMREGNFLEVLKSISGAENWIRVLDEE